MEATKMFTHCADLAHNCKESPLASRWSHLVTREFIEQVVLSNQNLDEKNLGIPQTPHFKNLTDPKTYLKSEVGFIDVIIAPMFEAANEFMKHSLDDIMSHLKERREGYEKKLEEFKQEETS